MNNCFVDCFGWERLPSVFLMPFLPAKLTLSTIRRCSGQAKLRMRCCALLRIIFCAGRRLLDFFVDPGKELFEVVESNIAHVSDAENLFF